jgi:superfamily II DNA/RNA helicase
VKAVSPSSFEGVPEDQHEAVAKELQRHVGILRESGVTRIVYNHPDNPGMDAVVEHAGKNRGKQGVVFAHSLDAVQQLKERLEKAGHRVVAITGDDSSTDKYAKIQKFRPEKGEPEADIMVASDAAATGANLQSGHWLYQYDTPETAKTHAQRNGRIHRMGQKNNVDLIDGIPDHPVVHRARARLATKYGLRDVLTSPLEGLDDTGLAHFLKKRQNEQQEGLL